MRLYYVTPVAAAALYTSIDGLPVVASSALRDTADAKKKPYVEGKIDRFLTVEYKNAFASKTGQDVEDALEDEERFRFLKRHKHKKKRKRKWKKDSASSNSTSGSSSGSGPDRDTDSKSRFHRFFD